MLPAEVQDSDRIRAHLNAALNAMNAAVEGVPLRYAHPGQQAAAGAAGAAGAGYSYAGAAGVLPFDMCPTFWRLCCVVPLASWSHRSKHLC